MKKTILSAALVLMMATSFQANALVGGVVAIAGGGATVALVGLGVIGGGGLITLACDGSGAPNGECSVPLAFGIIVGGILLDGENGQEIQFKKLAHNDLLKMNLTEDEARAFNDNTDELSVAFKMVSSELTKDSKVEDAKKLWEEQEAILGSDAINGARKVLESALKK